VANNDTKPPSDELEDTTKTKSENYGLNQAVRGRGVGAVWHGQGLLTLQPDQGHQQYPSQT